MTYPIRVTLAVVAVLTAICLATGCSDDPIAQRMRACENMCWRPLWPWPPPHYSEKDGCVCGTTQPDGGK